ncbi:MAG: fold metallo-hydrolase [Thermoleophilia bacterium]|nr:fold metallo-hydrolase [Thermoleophilia bacterium]
MIVTRSMHPDWLSNGYLVADQSGGTAVFIDAGAPIEPLMAAVEELGVRVTHVLLTHEHHDHTTHVVPLQERYGSILVTPETALADPTPIEVGALRIRAASTPGHCDPHVAWIVERNGAPIAAFTGDALFRDTVGGTLNGGPHGFAQLRSSILDVLLALPGEVDLYPGHTDATTVARELTSNPFVLRWRGEMPTGEEPVEVAGAPATLLLESADYDGGTKAWIRFDEDGAEAIVGGSMVTRTGART